MVNTNVPGILWSCLQKGGYLLVVSFAEIFVWENQQGRIWGALLTPPPLKFSCMSVNCNVYAM